MDEFATTVKELRTYLEDKPDDAPVIVTPPVGESFPLMGWTWSEPSHVVVLTGAEGVYDTTPNERQEIAMTGVEFAKKLSEEVRKIRLQRAGIPHDAPHVAFEDLPISDQENWIDAAEAAMTILRPDMVAIALYVDEDGEQQAQAYVSDQAAWRDIRTGAFGDGAHDGPIVLRSTVQS